MKSHEEINESLVDFALGELSEEQELAVETHLEQCQQCKCELRRLKALLEHTEQIRNSSASPEICRSAKQAILAAVESEQAKPAPGPNVSLEFTWRTIVKSKITQLAAAVVVVLVVCWLTVSDRGELEQQETNRPAVAVISKTPAELVSAISLSMVFRDGDMEAMEKQFDKAEKKVRPGLKERITIDQLICELEECEEI
jgi:anti-sigma factor RsiW